MPILDIVPLPSDDDTALIVMPLLRLFYDPPFSRASEVIDAVRQFMQVRHILYDAIHVLTPCSAYSSYTRTSLRIG